MRQSLCRFFIAAVFVVAAIGCSGQKYVEQDTPTGQVAPPIRTVAPQPYRPSYDTGAPPVESAESGEAEGITSRFDAGSIIPDFERVYQSAGSPRLAIFLNRSLSDEVREWKTRSRAVIAVGGNYSYQDENRSESVEGPAGVSVYGQQHVETTGRYHPGGEEWMWRFEDGFLGPFIDARARVVDRATIMRLTAAASGQQGSAYDPIAVKKIEMDALTGKADLFIEILIRREPKSAVGYAFKATAKEVNTGIIRANVTSLDWDYKGKKTEKVIATDTGYEFVEDSGGTESDLPDINVVSKDLALGLMRSLAHSWRQ